MENLRTCPEPVPVEVGVAEPRKKSTAPIRPIANPTRVQAIPKRHIIRRDRPASGSAMTDSSGGAFSVSSSSMTTSPMCWSRRLRSFVRQRRRSMRMFFGVDGGSWSQSGSRSIIRASVSVAVSPSKGRRPVSISYNTQPNDQMSVRRSAGLPRACSGLI